MSPLVIFSVLAAVFIFCIIMAARTRPGRHPRPVPQPAAAYEPHGIDTAETLAGIVAQAEAGTGCVRVPAYALQPEPAPVPLAPPPDMPYPSGMSRIMVHQIAYPDPADLSPGKDRRYRDMLRRVGVATGTRTPLEDTGTWALPALEPGDGTGVAL